MAIVEAMQTPDGLLPVNSKNITDSIDEKIDATLDDMIQKGGHGLMYPIMSTSDESLEKTSEEMIMQFVTQLGGISPEMIEKKKALLPVKPSKKYF